MKPNSNCYARTVLVATGFAVTLSVSACTIEPLEDEADPLVDKHDTIATDYRNVETIFGDGGFQLFGDRQPGDEGGALGVNSFLWRASLDTISFMPVNSADPFGGVIITDWHSPPAARQERFKLNIYILGRTLRADGVRVAVFRQVKSDNGWQDADVPNDTQIKVEDAILTRARQLRNIALQK